MGKFAMRNAPPRWTCPRGNVGITTYIFQASFVPTGRGSVQRFLIFSGMKYFPVRALNATFTPVGLPLAPMDSKIVAIGCGQTRIATISRVQSY